MSFCALRGSLLLAAVWLAVCPVSAGALGPSAATEASLKAVLLFKLPMFVYWQDGSQPARVEMCVLGESDLEEALKQLERRAKPERPVLTRTLIQGDELIGCTVLFVSRSERTRLEATLAEATYHPGLLTVSDLPGFAKAGGMVEFGMRSGDSNLSISINRAAARAQGIEFKAQLLRLARQVGD